MIEIILLLCLMTLLVNQFLGNDRAAMRDEYSQIFAE